MFEIEKAHTGLSRLNLESSGVKASSTQNNF
jgi:hypothetical protein